MRQLRGSGENEAVEDLCIAPSTTPAQTCTSIIKLDPLSPSRVCMRPYM